MTFYFFFFFYLLLFFYFFFTLSSYFFFLRSPPRSYSDQIRPNPTDTDQIWPIPTKSDQIRPNPPKFTSDQIRPNPTKSGRIRWSDSVGAASGRGPFLLNTCFYFFFTFLNFFSNISFTFFLESHTQKHNTHTRTHSLKNGQMTDRLTLSPWLQTCYSIVINFTFVFYRELNFRMESQKILLYGVWIFESSVSSNPWY